MRAQTLLLLLVALLLPSCSGQAATAPEPPQPAPTGLSGTLYALCGRGSNFELCSVDMATLSAEKLTDGALASEVGGHGDRVVVSHLEGPGADTISEWRDGALRPLALEDSHGSGPALSPDGLVAWARNEGGDPLRFSVRIWDGLSDRSEAIYEATKHGIGGPAWGADGQLALLHRTSEDSQIVLLRADGETVARMPLPDENETFGPVGWGRHIALFDMVQRSPTEIRFARLLDPEDGTSWQIPGWAPVAWSPDGERLLVRSSTNPRILGIVDGPDYEVGIFLGIASEPLGGGIWLERSVA